MTVTAIGVVLAAAAGALLRWRASERFNTALPTATFCINVAASFGAGLLGAVGETPDLIARVGFLGAASTWSTLALEVTVLARSHDRRVATIYLVLSILAGVGAAWLGLSLSHS